MSRREVRPSISFEAVVGRMLIADAREKNATLLAAADSVRLLAIENPNDKSHHWSYDVHVTTACGEEWRFEVKWNFEDAINSFLEREGEHSRIRRQSSYVDALLVVWDNMDFEMTCPAERKPAGRAVRTWLANRALVSDPPVIMFNSEAEAVDWLVKLKKRKERLRG